MDYFANPPRPFRENDERYNKRLAPTDGPTRCYNLMVAGMRSGKTSFLRLVLDSSTIAPTATKEQLASIAKFVQGSACHTSNIRGASVDVDLDVGNGYTRIALSVLDTPSIDGADPASAERAVSDILDYLEARLGEATEDPRTGDHLIHLCIYFLDPDVIVPPSGPGAQLLQLPRPRSNSYSQSEMVVLEPPVSSSPFLCRATLPPSEIANIRRLSARVNVLPVIARADTLSNDRLIAIKTAVRRDLADAGIGFGIFDLDSDIHSQEERLSSSSPLSPAPSPIPRLPYAMISPDQYSHSDGVSRMAMSRQELVIQYTPSPDILLNSNLARGRFLRSYRWGSLDVLDANHSDFLPLRKAIFYHMETLQNYTHRYLFVNFRQECQQKQQRSLPSHLLPSLTKVFHPPHSMPPQPLRPVLAIDTAAPPTASRPTPTHVLQQIGIGVEINSDQAHLRISKSSSSKASKQRKKITVACNFCRARKLKCDGERPQCGQCVKRSNPCDYMLDRRRKNGRPDQGDDSGSEEASDQPEYGDHSLSPETQSVPLSRRSSNGTRTRGSSYQAMGNHSNNSRQSDGSPPMSPPTSRPSTSSGGRPFFVDNDLPQIATLAMITDQSPATPMSAPSFAPIRPTENTTAAPRKRAATVPGKNTARETALGGKIVACNFCRSRKTKCDGMVPACSSCQRRSLPCNYVHTTGTKRGGTRRASTSKAASTPSSSSASASSGPVPSSAVYRSRQDSDATLHEYTEYSESPPLKKMRIDEPALVGTVP